MLTDEFTLPFSITKSVNDPNMIRFFSKKFVKKVPESWKYAKGDAATEMKLFPENNFQLKDAGVYIISKGSGEFDSPKHHNNFGQYINVIIRG